MQYFHNKGNLVINGNVLIENQTQGNATFAIDCLAGSSLVINNGEIKHSNGNDAIRAYQQSIANTSIVVNNGKIYGDYGAIWIQAGGTAELKIEINGGLLSGGARTIYSYDHNGTMENISLSITGGILKADKDNYSLDLHEGIIVEYAEGTLEGTINRK